MQRGQGPNADLHQGFAPPQQREYHNTQQSVGVLGSSGRHEFSFEQSNNQSRPLNHASLYGGNQGQQQGQQGQGHVRNQDYPPSPNNSGASFAMDSSYFDSSAAPLNDSFSQTGLTSRPSSIRSSFGSAPGPAARFEDTLEGSLYSGLQTHAPGSTGARSLLSGLREGTVELMDQNRDWNDFQPQQQQGGSPDWRGTVKY
jgi:hypothetical protein